MVSQWRLSNSKFESRGNALNFRVDASASADSNVTYSEQVIVSVLLAGQPSPVRHETRDVKARRAARVYSDSAVRFSLTLPDQTNHFRTDATKTLSMTM